MKQWKQKPSKIQGHKQLQKKPISLCRLPSKDNVHAAEEDLCKPGWNLFECCIRKKTRIMGPSGGFVVSLGILFGDQLPVSSNKKDKKGASKVGNGVTLRRWPAQGNAQEAREVWLTLALPSWKII